MWLEDYKEKTCKKLLRNKKSKIFYLLVYLWHVMNNQPFDRDVALLLANLVVEAYTKVEDYDVSKFNLEMITTLDNEKTDIQGFVAKDKNKLYISFRGANTVKDYLRDVDVLYENYPPSKRFFFKPKVHKGFFDGYLSVKNDILNAVLSNSDVDTLYITGHSMGSALAVYCAFDLTREFKHKDFNIILYTFGCPEVGNGSFVKRFKKHVKTSYRVVNDEDIVSKINLPGFSHVPTLVLITEHEIQINPSSFTRLKEAIDDPIAVITGEAIRDHLSRNYVKALEETTKIVD